MQNLENDEYTLYNTDELAGENDDTATAEIKSFTHFTYNEDVSTVQGNINGNGNLVLKVYYTRNTYTLSLSNPDLGTITNIGTYKYGSEIISIATVAFLGYDCGWYHENELLSRGLNYNFIIDDCP